MKTNHNLYLKLALNLAKINLGKTNSNSNLNLKDIATISIQEIIEINEKTIPNMMGKEQKG